MWKIHKTSFNSTYFKKSKKGHFAAVSIVEIEKKIKILVLIFDWRCVDFFIDIPQNLKATKIFQDSLDKYCPPFPQRVQRLAYAILWESYHSKFPDATKKDYEEKFLCSTLGLQCLQETSNYVISKIHEKPKWEDIENMLKEKKPEEAPKE